MIFEHARQLCAAMPNAHQDIKWGNDLVFTIGAKMFAVACLENDKATNFSFKVDADRFLELTDRDGIIPAPYMARAKWIQITNSEALSDAEVAALLHRSYQLVFSGLTKKLQREIGYVPIPGSP